MENLDDVDKLFSVTIFNFLLIEIYFSHL